MKQKLQELNWFNILTCAGIGLALTLLYGCGKDTQYVTGPQGPAGATGQMGAPGSNGSNGSDATVQYVQLCHGTTHYPDTFCEVAECVEGNLYGVYSANGGFDSKLPAGAYSSNGINCGCTVTIGSNCSVSN